MPERETVAIVARGDSMAPMVRDNWLVYYDNAQSAPDEKFLGMPHVVALTDGQLLIRDLHHGRSPGTWTLVAINGALMPDLEILWAQPIIRIKPRSANDR